MNAPAPLRLIVADVGGTNTRVALAEGARILPGTTRGYKNKDVAGIEVQLARYIAETDPGQIDGACVAGAGPVRDGAVIMTNLQDSAGAPWVIDSARVGAATGAARVAILNDLQAQGHALGHVAADQLHCVVDGPVEAGQSLLVVGLGTGVNAAPVHGSGAGRIVPPSECGHVNLPVRSDRDLRFARFVEAIPDDDGRLRRRASVEEALAGRGLGFLHDFAAGNPPVPDGTDSAQVFRALEAGDPHAVTAVGDYVRYLGQVLGDLALIHLPFGGIYLIGGMARAMRPHFATHNLTGVFREPRWIDLLSSSFRVTVVEDDAAALTGCAAYLTALLDS